MGRPAGWMQQLTGREAMRSPGAPSLRREVERQFWEQIVCVRATHLEAKLSSRESVHDEDHAHHGERSTRQSPRRRLYSPELKNQVMQECRQSGASVAGVALSHGINSNIVHSWLREQTPSALSVQSRAFVPVTLNDSAPGYAPQRSRTSVEATSSVFPTITRRRLEATNLAK